MGWGKVGAGQGSGGGGRCRGWAGAAWSFPAAHGSLHFPKHSPGSPGGGGTCAVQLLPCAGTMPAGRPLPAHLHRPLLHTCSAPCRTPAPPQHAHRWLEAPHGRGTLVGGFLWTQRPAQRPAPWCGHDDGHHVATEAQLQRRRRLRKDASPSPQALAHTSRARTQPHSDTKARIYGFLTPGLMGPRKTKGRSGRQPPRDQVSSL